jgi:hypothetical protein
VRGMANFSLNCGERILSIMKAQQRMCNVNSTSTGARKRDLVFKDQISRLAVRTGCGTDFPSNFLEESELSLSL